MNLQQLLDETKALDLNIANNVAQWGLSPHAGGINVQDGWAARTDGYIMAAAKLSLPLSDGWYPGSGVLERRPLAQPWVNLIPRPAKRATLDAQAVKALRGLCDAREGFPASRRCPILLHEGGASLDAEVPGLHLRASFGAPTGERLAAFGAGLLGMALGLAWFDAGVAIEADSPTRPVVLRDTTGERLALVMPLAGV